MRLNKTEINDLAISFFLGRRYLGGMSSGTGIDKSHSSRTCQFSAAFLIVSFRLRQSLAPSSLFSRLFFSRFFFFLALLFSRSCFKHYGNFLRWINLAQLPTVFFLGKKRGNIQCCGNSNPTFERLTCHCLCRKKIIGANKQEVSRNGTKQMHIWFELIRLDGI